MDCKPLESSVSPDETTVGRTRATRSVPSVTSTRPPLPEDLPTPRESFWKRSVLGDEKEDDGLLAGMFGVWQQGGLGGDLWTVDWIESHTVGRTRRATPNKDRIIKSRDSQIYTVFRGRRSRRSETGYHPTMSSAFDDPDHDGDRSKTAICRPQTQRPVKHTLSTCCLPSSSSHHRDTFKTAY